MCHVTEDITPIQKQDYEGLFWNLFNGGKIQYVRYSLNYNLYAMKTLIIRAMRMGFYEGANLSLAYCEECGHEELSMDVCPVCGSHNLTKIDRMNGYLAYSRVHGDTRLNSAKMGNSGCDSCCFLPKSRLRRFLSKRYGLPLAFFDRWDYNLLL